MDRDRAHLLDILEAARLAVAYLEGLSEEEFLADSQRQDSAIRRLEIIGEAARRVSSETQADHPEIPWSAMIGMRNILIHRYDDVDLSLVFRTVRTDLARLIAVLEPLVLPPGLERG